MTATLDMPMVRAAVRASLDARAEWEEAHGIRRPAVQGDLFGADAVGDLYRLRQDETIDTIGQARAREERERRAAELDGKQERMF